jgi:hypothetical protein
VLHLVDHKGNDRPLGEIAVRPKINDSNVAESLEDDDWSMRS